MVRALVVLALIAISVAPADARRRGGICEDQQKATQLMAGMERKWDDLERTNPDIYNNYPVIELVTMGIGSLIWERHGHIALCVKESPTKRTCFNYGIGDFAKPLAMATGFFRGTKSFWVGPQNPYEMLSIYLCADRTIWIQPLPITDKTARDKILEKLRFDIKDENRHYAYDHFWDNCTTRVRDVIDNAIGNQLKTWAATQPSDGRTYRDLARDGFYGMRVPLIITDIAMGRVTDAVPSYWERMFLPDYMRDAANAYPGWKSALGKPIEEFIIYKRQGPPPLKDGPSGRFIFAFILLLLTAPAWATRLWGKFEKTGLAVAVIPYVFLGSVFWFLAIISPLPYVESNESCLILLPTDLLLVWFLSPERRRLYARIRVGMIAVCALLLLVGVLKMPIWPLLLWPLVPAAVVGFWPSDWPKRR